MDVWAFETVAVLSCGRMSTKQNLQSTSKLYKTQKLVDQEDQEHANRVHAFKALI